MRIRVSFAIGALLVAACGGASSAASAPRAPSTTLAASVAGVPTSTLPPVPMDPRPVWEGFAASADEVGTLAVQVEGPIDVYERPNAAEPMKTLDANTILGTVTVLGVVGEPTDDWVEVMLPTRPNGSTGWVRSDEVLFYVADSLIEVDLTALSLTYTVDGVEVLSTEVGIGSQSNQTPPGEYFVTDSVTLANPDSPWGPHALGISAYSETITSFNGGDGIIGIHGTNNASSIGADISLGCIRLPNDMITALHSMVPLGTRVEIRG